jgi:hypothetical protein
MDGLLAMDAICLSRKAKIKSFFCSQDWHGKRYLVSPFWDVALSGGVALIYLMWAFIWTEEVEASSRSSVVNMRAAALFAFVSYLINYPHFMASYGLLYTDFKSRIRHHLRSPSVYGARYIFASFVVPVVMIWAFIYGGYLKDLNYFAWGVLAMYFFVGWHYSKQSFGVMMVLSSLRGIKFHAAERRMMLINVYVVWLISWLSAYKVVPGTGIDVMNSNSFSFTGTALRVPEHMLAIGQLIVIVYLILVVIMWIVKWVREKQRLPTSAMVGYLSVYILLLWGLKNPLWAVATPFFHCIQYLLFVYALKRGEVDKANDEGGAQQKQIKIVSNQVFVIGILFMGVMSFEVFPNHLQRWLFSAGWQLPCVVAFNIFINVHHYFIDNVIWKRENTQIWEHLFYRPESRESE